MKHAIAGAALFALLTVAGFTFAQDKGTRSEVDDQEIVVIELADGDDGPKPPEPVKFNQSTVVRVRGSVRSGGMVTAKVMGDGKLIRRATVSRMIGRHFAIGALEKEFDVRLNKGTTTIVINSIVPEDKSLTNTVTYTLTVDESK